MPSDGRGLNDRATISYMLQEVSARNIVAAVVLLLTYTKIKSIKRTTLIKPHAADHKP